MLRCLCLHGAEQDAEVFRYKTERLRAVLADKVNFVFLDAPFLHPKRNVDDDLEMRCWFPATAESRSETSSSASILADAPIPAILECWTANGGFDLIIGFSQGCAAAVALIGHAVTKEANPVLATLRGCVFFGSPGPDYVPLLPLLNSSAPVVPPHVRCLFVCGAADVLTPPADSEEAAAAFCASGASELVLHSGGHCVPTTTVALRAVVAFVESLVLPLDAETRAAALTDEIELIRVVFGEGTVTVTAPSNEMPRAGHAGSTPRAPLSTVVSLDVGETVPGAVIAVRVPSQYPSLPAALSFPALPTSLIRDCAFAARVVREAAAIAAAAAADGSPALLQLLGFARGALEERIASGGNNTNTNSSSGNVDVRREKKGGDAEKDAVVSALDLMWLGEEDIIGNETRRRSDMRWAHEAATAALLEARRLASSASSGANGNSAHATGDATPPAAPAAAAAASLLSRASEGGGEWTYCIGLVGKPSAGKSTFFNAVTDPSSEAEAAKVGAFPFTTIEPNVGKAFVAMPCACQTLDAFAENNNNAGGGGVLRCGAQFGHFPGTLLRRVPVTIKDVAGLVPGAYLGRGKGNRFLNDLCDADVLVHVVDGSGTSNAQGESEEPVGAGEDDDDDNTNRNRNVASSATDETTPDDAVQSEAAPLQSQRQPEDDVRWVREEIHAWIYDNVRAKWDVIRRKPLRLLGMFSGYHARPGVVEASLELAGGPHALRTLSEVVPTWQPRDLHRLVACFLALRFPMVLAVNKCDRPNGMVNAARVRHVFPAETVVPMTARLECDLLALRKRGAVTYLSGGATVSATVTGAGGSGSNNKSKDDAAAKNEARTELFVAKAQSCLTALGSTGTSAALAAAVSLRPAALVFPVSDFVSYSAIGGGGGGEVAANSQALRDCVLMHRGAMVEDVFTVLAARGRVEGNFVRCEAIVPAPGSTHVSSLSGQPVIIRRRDDVIPALSVLRVMTNRKHGKATS